MQFPLTPPSETCAGLDAPATTVLGSAWSRAESKTYTVHHGSCRCLCRSLQNARVRFVRLHAAHTGVFESNGFRTAYGCHCTMRRVIGRSMYFPSSSVHELSTVTQTYAVVHGGAVCVLRTRHMSRVLKFFLHLSQTASLESGNLTLKVCLKPGGVKHKMF